MGDHKSSQLPLFYDLIGQLQYLFGSLGIQGRRVLVQKEEPGLFQSRHQKCQRLALSPGKKTHLTGHPGLEPQPQLRQGFPVKILFIGLDPPGKPPLPSSPEGQSQIFLDLHARGRSPHGILEHAADVLGPFIFRLPGDVDAVDLDLSRIDGIYPGDHVQHGGFSGSVSPDDRHKVAGIQVKVQTAEGLFLIDGSFIECFPYIGDRKHYESSSPVSEYSFLALHFPRSTGTLKEKATNTAVNRFMSLVSRPTRSTRARIRK